MSLTLADINLREKGTITSVKAAGEIRRRLMDMGLIKGSAFQVIRRAPLGDPIEIRVKGFNLSLRVEEAKSVFVEKDGDT